MKERYQREEYCSDQRKDSLCHFQPPKNLGSNFKAMLELLLRQNRNKQRRYPEKKQGFGASHNAPNVTQLREPRQSYLSCCKQGLRVLTAGH
jgi:hypothetical protein